LTFECATTWFSVGAPASMLKPYELDATVTSFIDRTPPVDSDRTPYTAC
jgi:hypothetical protein